MTGREREREREGERKRERAEEGTRKQAKSKISRRDSDKLTDSLPDPPVQACWVIIWNAIEIAALSDRKRAVPRLPPPALAFVELLTLLLCLLSSILMGLQDLYPNTVANPSRAYAVYLQGAVA